LLFEFEFELFKALVNVLVGMLRRLLKIFFNNALTLLLLVTFLLLTTLINSSFVIKSFAKLKLLSKPFVLGFLFGGIIYYYKGDIKI